jgi:hypothetical protein
LKLLLRFAKLGGGKSPTEFPCGLVADDADSESGRR